MLDTDPRVINTRENLPPKKDVAPGGFVRTVTGERFIEYDDNSKLEFVLVAVVAFMVVATSLGLYLYKGSKTQELVTLNRVQEELNAKLNSADYVKIDKLATDYSIGLSQLSNLINKPVKYSLLFDELEKILPLDVSVQGLSVDSKGKVRISVLAKNSLAESEFTKGMENSKFFSTLQLEGKQQSTIKGEDNFYTLNFTANLNSGQLVSTMGGTNE